VDAMIDTAGTITNAASWVHAEVAFVYAVTHAGLFPLLSSPVVRPSSHLDRLSATLHCLLATLYAVCAGRTLFSLFLPLSASSGAPSSHS
jgi:hypothetical protein